jgi:hypothetical protein
MIARCDETGWMFDGTVDQVRASNVPIPSPVLAFAPPELRDGAWLLPYESRHHVGQGVSKSEPDHGDHGHVRPTSDTTCYDRPEYPRRTK